MSGVEAHSCAPAALLALACVAAVLGARPVAVPIDGNYQELFMYFLTVQAGTPPKNFTVVVDTGSSDFLIPAAVCDTCAGGEPSTFYNASESSSYLAVQCTNTTYKCTACVGPDSSCGFQMPYVGITESAAGVQDDVNLGGLAQQLVFGAILNISFDSDVVVANSASGSHRRSVARRSFDRYPEGMMGMAFAELNSLGTTPIFDALVGSGQVEDMFSMCLTMGGGVLVLGGMRVPEEEYTFTPIIKPDYYRFTMQDITVNNMSIGITPEEYNGGNCIVDTGTPVPTVTPQAFKALRDVFVSNCSESNLVGVCTGLNDNRTVFEQECYALSEEQIDAYPDITMKLDGVDLVYPPQSYLMKMYYCRKGYVGLGIGIEADWTIVGAKLLQSYDTVYDKKGMRIGFAASSEPCVMP